MAFATQLGKAPEDVEQFRDGSGSDLKRSTTTTALRQKKLDRLLGLQKTATVVVLGETWCQLLPAVENSKGIPKNLMGQNFMRIHLNLMCLAILALSACSQRGTLALLPADSIPTQKETVLVSTSRAISKPPEFFGDARSYQTNYAEIEISVPPNRESGELEYPRGDQVDPSKQFLVASVTKLENQNEFIRAINSNVKSQSDGLTQGSIFIHGFNTNYAEGVMRATALLQDTGRKGVKVVYSWPSAGSLLKYLDDRESALFARDSLQETLHAMSRSNLSDYLVVGHSMGTFVVMDTLREMATQNATSALRKIKAVVLISADLDIDVFRKQAMPVLSAGVPIVLVTTSDDLALRLSAKLRGQGDRLGDIRSTAELGGLQIPVFDFTQVTTGDPLKHWKIGSSPHVLKFLKELNQSGHGILSGSAQASPVNVNASSLQSATGVILLQ